MRAAAYCGTRNLYPDMVTAIKSLLCNSNVEKIWLLIEDAKFPYELPDCCETIDVSGQTFFAADGPNMNNSYTYMAMMRATLARVLPKDLDRVLSLDVDTIVDKDISDIWNIDLHDCYFAASHEWHRSKGTYIYTNAGVTLFNLRKIREDGKDLEAIRDLNTVKHRYLDQDTFNNICQGHIYDLPSEYNSNYYTEKVAVPKIIHHIGNARKLCEYSDVMKYAKMTWEEVDAVRKL